jgi:protein TonB
VHLDAPGAALIDDPANIVRPAQAGMGNPAPVYPAESARRHEEGVVFLRLYIDEDGLVSQVEIAQSSGFPRLDAAARAQAAKWHFSPAMRGDTPVADVIVYGVNFRLD